MTTITETIHLSKTYYSISDCIKVYKKGIQNCKKNNNLKINIQVSPSALTEVYLEDKWSFSELAKALPKIEDLGLICYYNNWSGLEDFKNLKELFLGEAERMNILIKKYPHIDKSKQYYDIDLLNYPFLESFNTWTLKQIYNLEKTTIKKLTLGNCKEIKNDLKVVKFPKSTEHLKLCVGSIIKLEGIEKLENIKVLELVVARKLESIGAIDKLPNLMKLKIAECKKIDYSKFTTNENIKDLSIQLLELKGGIPDLKFLRNLPNLENLAILFKIDDGDLSPIFDLPKLKRVWFKDRKHYSHTLQQILEITRANQLTGEYLI